MQKFSNNGHEVLSGNILSTDLTIPLVGVTTLPTLAAGDYFYGSLVNTSNDIEHFLCTAITGNNLTVPAGGRGLGGTTARSYASGDAMQLRPITLSLLQLMLEAHTAIAASGTDTYTATYSPAPIAYATYREFLLHFANTNTVAAPTLNVNSLGAKTIVKDGGAALVAGDIPTEARLRYDGTNVVLLNPRTGSGVAGSYTPAWGASGVAPSIGDGTLTGSYTRLAANLVHFLATIQFGGTTTAGSGTYTISLPFAAGALAANVRVPGSAVLHDASTGIDYVCAVSFGAGATTFTLQNDGSANLLSGSNPVALTVGDYIQVSAIYPAAA